MAAKAWDVAGYQQVVRRAVRNRNRAVSTAQNIASDPASMRALAQVAADNASSVFASQGATGGVRWRTDHVDTGTLRARMTTAGALLSTATKRRIVFRPAVKYRKYVSIVFLWTKRHQAESAQVASDRMLAIASGKR